MSDKLKFAVDLGTFRRLKGWTMALAAQKCGLTEDQYKHVEEGQHEPLAGTWNAVLIGLDLDPAAFPPSSFERADPAVRP